MDFIKPKKLVRGDTVGIVSPSWGAPSEFPEIYEKGIKELENLGLKTKEFPTARMDADTLRNNPKRRADDIVQAFTDPEVKAIVASIGGDDSVRVLEYLDWDVIKNNPKIVLGYSDITTLLATLNMRGLVTFNGPCVMAGFAQIQDLPAWREHVLEMLFDNPDEYQYSEFRTYSEGYPSWSDLSQIGKVLPKKKSSGWRWIQGNGTSTGTLFGGCIEVLEFLKGTRYWPEEEFWNDKIVFFETSEGKPSVLNVKWMLRNYGVQGVFTRASAILFGRARSYSEAEKVELDKAIIDIVAGEFSCPNLSIVTNMDFGHTDPQMILPLGVRAQLDSHAKTFRLVEGALSET